MELRGKNVLLTGASRGIGPVIAQVLAEAGARLVLVARNAEALERVAASVGGVAVPADLRSHDYDGLVARVGPIDVLVNNAALDVQTHYVETTNAQISELLNVDLVAPMLLTKAVLPGMLARKSGQIVNIASLAGKSGTAFNALYSAAKGGLIAFSHSLRAELDGQGVGVSVVSPGFITEQGMFATKSAMMDNVMPSKLIGTSTPLQVAQAVRTAIEQNRSEIIVNPGPMRLLLALNQFMPTLMPSLTKRLGMNDLFAAATTIGPAP
jgi:uncharacterized protein